MKNVSCGEYSYDRLNDWNSTINTTVQAAWYIKNEYVRVANSYLMPIIIPAMSNKLDE